MKKLLVAAALLAAGSASAATMECMVDTAGWDEWSAGHCESFEYTMDKKANNAYWRITGINKTISSVIWSDKTTGCASSATECMKAIFPYRINKGTATILYVDGTYEIVSATASFETGF